MSASLGLTLIAVVLAPSPAAAAGKPYTCEASVLRGSVGVAPAVEPLVANRGLACQTAVAGLPNLGTALPGLRTGVLAAGTQRPGPADRADLQQALASAYITDLGVGSLGSLGLALPLDQVPLPAQLQSVPVNISAVTGLLNPVLLLAGAAPLPTTLNVDIAAAVRELVKLPTQDVLGVKTIYSIAGAQCIGGKPVTGSQRTVADLTVLGNAISADTVSTNAPILDTQMIDPSKIDLTKVKIPALDGLTGGLLATVLAQVNPIVANAIKALPPVALPIDLLRVSVTPGAQTRTADSLTQSALGIKVTALGMPVVDLVLGEAKVGTAGVDCTPPVIAQTPAEKAKIKEQEAAAPAVVAQAPLSCTSRRLVLTDVVRRGDRVKITGVADKRYVGRFVTIRFEADRLTAGRALVAPNGTFATTAALPSKRLRASNRARYQAVLGTEKSLNLKLERRAYVDRLTSRDGKVTVRGHLTRPLGSPLQTITLSRRVSCKRMEVVKRFKSRADGTFSVTVAAPKGQTSAVYRLGTKVRKTLGNRKLFPTFTLPQGVDLKQ